MATKSRNRSARHRAKLKAKKRKERLRKAGLLKVRKAGGRMKPTGESKRAHGLR